MTRDEIVELAAGYALGGLEGAERDRFEALLRDGDPTAAAALAEFEETLTALAEESAVPAPPGVRHAVMARLDIAPARPRVAPPAVRRLRVRWAAVWAGAAAAGIAAVLIGMAVAGNYERRLAELAREAAALRAEVARLEGEIGQQRALAALLRDPATQVVALAGQPAAPGARARMVWHPRAGGQFLTAGLPALPEGRTYQLWAIVGRTPPVPAGLFTVDASGAASLRVAPLAGVEAVDVFAVTQEPAGGLPAPSGPMVLAGKS